MFIHQIIIFWDCFVKSKTPAAWIGGRGASVCGQQHAWGNQSSDLEINTVIVNRVIAICLACYLCKGLFVQMDGV